MVMRVIKMVDATGLEPVTIPRPLRRMNPTLKTKLTSNPRACGYVCGFEATKKRAFTAYSIKSAEEGITGKK